MRSALCVAAALFAATLCAQDNAIVVNVTKYVDMPPEEMIFALSLQADQSTTVEEAVQVLKDAGVTQKDLIMISMQPGMSPYGGQQSRIMYQFSLTAPYAKYKETMDKLQAVRRTLVIDWPSMDLQVMMAQIGVSDASREQARLKTLPDLVADARRKAEELAKAAGIGVGPILGLSEAAQAPYYGGVYPSTYGPLRTAFTLSVRFAVK